MMRVIALATLIAVALTAPALAGSRRSTCTEVRDPGVGTYRICAPAPRRR